MWPLMLQAIFFATFYISCAIGVELQPLTNDQCPDRFEVPLEYRSIVHHVVINNTGHGGQPCVVITQCSVDRLHNLEKLANAWNGAISVAVYVSTASDAIQTESLAQVEAFATKMRTYRGWLSISLLYGHEDSPWRYDCPEVPSPRMPLYPINNLRNLAVVGSGGPDGSTFPLYLLLDSDFMPSAHLRSWIHTHADSGLIERCRKGDMIVLPALETSLPVTRPTLSFALAGMANGTVVQFHADRYLPGHAPTNYSLWMQLSEQSKRPAGHNDTIHTYPVINADGYEPYVIVHRDTFIPYDERFRGYGRNKIVQLRGMVHRGATYHVLPRHFVVEQKHRNGQNYERYRNDMDTRGLGSWLLMAFERSRLEIEAGAFPLLSNTTRRQFQEYLPHRMLY